MDVEKLIRRLRNDDDAYRNGETLGRAFADQEDVLDNAATALSTLQAENAEMQKQLNEFSEFLCRMTGGLLSKTNYTAQEMATAAEDYQQKVCGECDLQAENEKLRADLNDLKAQWDMYGGDEGITATFAELERVKQERDAAVKDLETLCRDDVGPCEMAICELCAYNSGVQCSNPDGRSCDGYDVFNWKWRGQKEE